nr:hypothetical protein [Tanacetum cinerariifolium]
MAAIKSFEDGLMEVEEKLEEIFTRFQKCCTQVRQEFSLRSDQNNKNTDYFKEFVEEDSKGNPTISEDGTDSLKEQGEDDWQPAIENDLQNIQDTLDCCNLKPRMVVTRDDRARSKSSRCLYGPDLRSDHVLHLVVVQGMTWDPGIRMIKILKQHLEDKGGKLELFWKVCERLSECDVKRDVYTYGNVIKGYCMSGKMEDAKRVFSEMEDNDCSPNLVTYNLLIGGLCQNGLVDEAIGYKKVMVEKGVVPDAYSYSVIIDELCKRNRFSDAKLVLDDMNRAGLRPKSALFLQLVDERLLLPPKQTPTEADKNSCTRLLMDFLTQKGYTDERDDIINIVSLRKHSSLDTHINPFNEDETITPKQ